MAARVTDSRQHMFKIGTQDIYLKDILYPNFGHACCLGSVTCDRRSKL